MSVLLMSRGMTRVSSPFIRVIRVIHSILSTCAMPSVVSHPEAGAACNHRSYYIREVREDACLQPEEV